MIRGDSKEYDLLKEWCETTPLSTNQKQFLTCEIGVREGLGSKIIMDEFIDRLQDKNYKHIGIDPYGNLEYQHYDDSPSYTADYTEGMRGELQKDLSIYHEFDLYHMKDTDFMNRYWDYGPFNFVHFDGPHMTKDVLTECIWFANRSITGSRFVFDDYKKYNIKTIEDVLSSFDFNKIGFGDNKICFERKKI